MFRKYIKENALEDMKVELSNMKSKLNEIEQRNNIVFNSDYFYSNFARPSSLVEDTTDFKIDISCLKRVIELSERESA